jgi:hypothetical protein
MEMREDPATPDVDAFRPWTSLDEFNPERLRRAVYASHKLDKYRQVRLGLAAWYETHERVTEVEELAEMLEIDEESLRAQMEAPAAKQWASLPDDIDLSRLMPAPHIVVIHGVAIPGIVSANRLTAYGPPPASALEKLLEDQLELARELRETTESGQPEFLYDRAVEHKSASPPAVQPFPLEMQANTDALPLEKCFALDESDSQPPLRR